MSKQNLRAITLFAPLGLAVLLSPGLTAAEEDGNRWEAESSSYRAYLGVVPASLINRKPVLVDGDKDLHGGAENRHADSQHVMVAIYRKAGNARVTNATVIAEVESGRLLGGSEQEKPLERMATTGGVTYGNYFAMPESGEYEIEVSVYEPDREGKEELTLRYIRP